MQAYYILPGQDIAGLTLSAKEGRDLRANEVRIRIHAVSLNYRDLMVAQGRYLVSTGHPVIPTSDAAGKVVAIGKEVTRFKQGDRVIGSFFPKWIDGPPTSENTGVALGGNIDGVLAEEVIMHEDAVASMPAHLDYTEAATMPCAGVTAWNTLFVNSTLKPGQTVLMLGTGGVSIWALQLAKAAGLRTIITSSSDEKLERARALGADATINYRKTPQWHDEVLRLTEGQGVDLASEVGGHDTIKSSIASTRMGGNIAIIGGVTGFAIDVDPLSLIGGTKRLSGIFVGSRAMLEDLSRFVSIASIRPVVDRVFAFDEVREAYSALQSGRHFGKIVVRVNG
jgi:NADPH:quinone reductase-like Zn-dependent oxidoreductase